MCGIRSKKFTTDVRMRRSTFCSREGHWCVRWYPGPSASCSSANRAANTMYQFAEMGVYCYYYAHLDGYVEGLRGECGSSVGTSSVLPDRLEMRTRARHTCILRSSSWGRKGCGGRGRPSTHILAS